MNGLKLEPDWGYDNFTLSKLLSLKFLPPMYAITSPKFGLIDISEDSARGIWSIL